MRSLGLDSVKTLPRGRGRRADVIISTNTAYDHVGRPLIPWRGPARFTSSSPRGANRVSTLVTCAQSRDAQYLIKTYDTARSIADATSSPTPSPRRRIGVDLETDVSGRTLVLSPSPPRYLAQVRLDESERTDRRAVHHHGPRAKCHRRTAGRPGRVRSRQPARLQGRNETGEPST